MKKFTNHSPGLRGINTISGTVWIEAGQSETIDPSTIVGPLPDLGKARARADDVDDADATLKAAVAAAREEVSKAADARIASITEAHATALNEQIALTETAEKELAEAQAKIDEISKDLAERDAAEAKRLSTTGKNKAQLLGLAADEGVKIEDGATNADIASAIDLAREEAAKPSA